MSQLPPVPVTAEPGHEVDPVLASLPLSFRLAYDTDGAVAAVRGAAGWPAEVARELASGCVCVVVIHPEPADTARLRDTGGRVVLDPRWAGNPVLPAAAAAFIAALPHAERLECDVRHAVGFDLEQALLDQLLLVRALIGAASEVTMLSHSGRGYAAEGVVAGHPVDLGLVCTDAVPERAWVRLLTSDGSIELSIPGGATAQPAILRTTGPQGSTLAPTLYEAGHRATWRRVSTLLSERSALHDLEDFASDRTTARNAFPTSLG